MRRNSFMGLIMLLAMAFSSVSAQKKGDLTTGQQVLSGTEWRLVSMGKVGAEVPVPSGATVVLRFRNDGRVSGSGGCNSYGGGYQVKGDNLMFTQIFSTKRACLSEELNTLETKYFAALGSASRFRLSARSLSIYYEGGGSMLDFAKAGASDEEAASTPQDPVAMLNAYYQAINDKDYEKAYGYWETPAQSKDQFIRGFANTASVRILVDPEPGVEGAAGSSYANVSTILISKRNDGGEQVFAGCYVVRKSNVTPEDEKGWRIYKGSMSPLRPGRLGAQICSPEP